MDIIQLIVLSLVQGVTEFLPISSSAHLILPSRLLGWPDQGLAFDVAVHAGTLLEVVAYFRRDLLLMLSDGARQCLQGQPATEHSRQAGFLILATVPAVVFGLLVSITGLDDMMRSEAVIAATTLVFGLLLGWADVVARHRRNSTVIEAKHAWMLGLAQALAIIPGTSRSGVTITAGLALGMTRDAASRFSFLMSIPVTAAATALMLCKLWLSAGEIHGMDMLVGAVLSAVSAWLCIHCFLALVNRIGLLPFVVYRVLLAGVLVAILW